MNLGAWLRMLDTVGGLAAASRRFRDATTAGATPEEPARQPGQLETRLAGVLVAALKEAFDRDRARLDLEHSELEEQRRRAEEGQRLELLRQAGERALGHVRVVALIGVSAWAVSAILAVALPGMREPLARILLAGGWAGLIGTVASAFLAHQQLAGWLAAASAPGAAPALEPRSFAAHAAPWLLIGGLGLTAASLIAAL